VSGRGQLTPEQRKKLSKALTGRRFSEEHRVKISKALTGRKLSEEHRNKMSAFMLGNNPSEESRRKMSIARKGKKLSEEAVRKMRDSKTGKEPTRDDFKKGPNHMLSLVGEIRDPEGRVHRIRNVTHFVRENPHLFNPEDIVWRTDKGRGCLAQKGISSVLSTARSAVSSWKGWTKVSNTEVFYNDSKDLLDRDVQAMEDHANRALGDY
jgi:hypothetical protein